MENARKSPRISTDLKLISRTTGNSVDSRVINMSIGGVFIKTCHLLPVDAEFPLSLQLPDDPEIITLRARVVWTKAMSGASPAGMGIQFVDISGDIENKIYTFITATAAEQNSIPAVRMFV